MQFGASKKQLAIRNTTCLKSCRNNIFRQKFKKFNVENPSTRKFSFVKSMCNSATCKKRCNLKIVQFLFNNPYTCCSTNTRTKQLQISPKNITIWKIMHLENNNFFSV